MRGSVAEVVAQVLARLGVGQTLRLRRSGAGGTVEVLARADGALEVPAAVIGVSDTGPHVLFARHRSEELAGLLVAAIDDLELVTSSVVDGAGVERLLDGTGARTDTTVDGLLDRWDLPLIEQVRRYLAQRFSVSPSELTSPWPSIIFFSIGRLPHVVEVLSEPRRIRIGATVVQEIGGGEQLALALHHLNDNDGLVRLRHHRNKVLAEVVLPAPTFMGQHVDAALSAIGGGDVVNATDAIVNAFGGVASFRKRYSPRLSDVIDPDPDLDDSKEERP